MLDVHPPHESSHTWKDFFIHIATICIGLLIAIALEQAVEALHHHHQRVRLEEDIRAEAEQNIRIIDDDFATDLPQLSWLGSAMRVVRDAPLKNGVVLVTLPPSPVLFKAHTFSGNDQSTTPSHSVWAIAQATGQVELLPLARAKIYDRLEREAVAYIYTDGQADLENSDYVAVLRDLNVEFGPEKTLRLTATQRDTLVHAVNHHAQTQYWDEIRLSFWKGASLAILHNVQTPEEVFAYMTPQNAAIPKP